MPWLLLFLLATGGLVAAAPESGSTLFRGTARRVVFSDRKSTTARLARLRATFGPSVEDQGAGVYLVTPERDMSFQAPAGATLEGMGFGNSWYSIGYRGRGGKTGSWGKPIWTDFSTVLELMPLGAGLLQWVDGSWQVLKR